MPRILCLIALIALGAPADVLTPAAVKQLYGVEVVIGPIEGSSVRLCAPVLTE